MKFIFNIIVNFFLGFILRIFFSSSLLLLLWLFAYRYFPPHFVIDLSENERIITTKKWLPLKNIPDETILAFMLLQDNRFLQHNGFDVESIRNNILANAGIQDVFGNKTITQQTVHQVFLFYRDDIYLRPINWWISFLMEICWNKAKILEFYFNTIKIKKAYGLHEIADRKNKKKQNINQQSVEMAIDYFLENKKEQIDKSKLEKIKLELIHAIEKYPKKDFLQHKLNS